MIGSMPPTSANPIWRSDTAGSALCSSTSVSSPRMAGEGVTLSTRTIIPAPPENTSASTRMPGYNGVRSSRRRVSIRSCVLKVRLNGGVMRSSVATGSAPARPMLRG